MNLNESLLTTDKKELPEVIFLEKENSYELGKAISQLKPIFQELVLLKYISELTYEEISSLLDINVSSIKTNLYRERKKLEKIYKEVNHE